MLIAQKEKVSEDAIRAAQKEVAIFRTEVFDLLLNKLYSRLERWFALTSSHQQQAFIDAIISPHELVGLFVREEDPVVSPDKVNSVIPDI